MEKQPIGNLEKPSEFSSIIQNQTKPHNNIENSYYNEKDHDHDRHYNHSRPRHFETHNEYKKKMNYRKEYRHDSNHSRYRNDEKYFTRDKNSDHFYNHHISSNFRASHDRSHRPILNRSVGYRNESDHLYVLNPKSIQKNFEKHKISENYGRSERNDYYREKLSDSKSNRKDRFRRERPQSNDSFSDYQTFSSTFNASQNNPSKKINEINEQDNHNANTKVIGNSCTDMYERNLYPNLSNSVSHTNKRKYENSTNQRNTSTFDSNRNAYSIKFNQTHFKSKKEILPDMLTASTNHDKRISQNNDLSYNISTNIEGKEIITEHVDTHFVDFSNNTKSQHISTETKPKSDTSNNHIDIFLKNENNIKVKMAALSFQSMKWFSSLSPRKQKYFLHLENQMKLSCKLHQYHLDRALVVLKKIEIEARLDALKSRFENFTKFSSCTK